MLLADEYVNDTVGRQSPPQVKELAAQLQLSRTEFSRLFAHVVGEQPSKYLRRGQIACAKQLLTNTQLSMNAIAYQCGFGTRTTFFRAFKRETGLTPSDYRRAKQ
jgi:AraC-like DNA-binding protein